MGTVMVGKSAKRPKSSKRTVSRRRIGKAEEAGLKACIIEVLGEPDCDFTSWSHDIAYPVLGGANYAYCPYDDTGYEHPSENWDWVDLPWSQKRKESIESGRAEPAEKELNQWRRATAQALIEVNEAPMALSIVPIQVINPKTPAKAIVVFVSDLRGAPEDGIGLWGIYPSEEAAIATLSKTGALKKADY